MHPWSLSNPRRSLRVFGYVCNNLADTDFDGGRYRFAKRATVSRRFAEIGHRTIGVFDLHARRNVLNAASTSALFTELSGGNFP